jgi:hypothetical protein
MLDLFNNDLVITTATASAYETAAKNGLLLTSAGPPAGATATMAVGILTGKQYHAYNGASALFDGQSVADTAVLLKYTYGGDATGDGRITTDDYLALNAGYLFAQSGWANGDFDHSGVIDAADFALIDGNYRKQNGQVAAEPLMELHASWFGADYLAALEGASAIPEPGTGLCLALATVPLLVRRRRGEKSNIG